MLIRCAGVTFVEILVALAINIVLLLGITSLFNINFGYFGTAVNADMLQQQLQMSVDFMANDIQRAGYWSNASSNINISAANNNPFMVTNSTDVSITGGNCILFTYDHAKNGVLPAIAAGSDDDRYGYRLVSQVLQTRPPGAVFACNAATNNWENVTDSNIVQITALTFSLNQQNVPVGGPNYMGVRAITITITGQLTANSTITKTLTQTVRIRNDIYIP